MKTRLRGEPCPHDLADEFKAWVRAAPFAELLRAWETRLWWRPASTGRLGGCNYRINPGMLEHLKRRLAELVVRHHHGAYCTDDLVLRSDGERVWTEMSPGKVRMKYYIGME